MNIQDIAGPASGLVVSLGVVVGWFKIIRPKARSLFGDLRAARDSLLGREAVLDSITGKQIAPALPGVGERVSLLEESQLVIGGALARLADANDRLGSHTRRLDRLESIVGTGKE